MIALDTNVIVRVVTGDDPEQLSVALEVMRSGELWICKTVLLETEWVLRYTYKLSREAILEALRRLLGFRSLQMEDRSSVLQAVSLFEEGMDFADALHLVSGSRALSFATFDKTLAKTAKGAEREGIPPVTFLTAAGA
jgi:predicted nucleic-acid-binding protein